MPDGLAERRFQLFESVREFLADSAADAGLLVVFGDVHWADAPSLRLLRHLAVGIGASRLLLPATYRDTETGGRDELTGLLAALAREDTVSRIRLTALSQDEVARQLAAVTGSQASYTRALRATSGQGPADRCRLLRGLGLAELRGFDLAAGSNTLREAASAARGGRPPPDRRGRPGHGGLHRPGLGLLSASEDKGLTVTSIKFSTMDRDKRAVHAEPVRKKQNLFAGVGDDRQATGHRDGTHPAFRGHHRIVSAVFPEPAKVALLDAEQFIVRFQRAACQLASSPGNPGIQELRDARGHRYILSEESPPRYRLSHHPPSLRRTTTSH